MNVKRKETETLDTENEMIGPPVSLDDVPPPDPADLRDAGGVLISDADMADALNVSNIHCGWLARWLGHGLSDYHSLHHLSPAIPCYHLPAAEAIVAPDLAPLRAPAIDLLKPAACAVLFDGIFSGVVHKNSEAWDYEPPGGMRRVATPETDA